MMAKPRSALEPALEYRRLTEERLRLEVVAYARACTLAREAWHEAAQRLQAAARDRAVLERFEARRREAWLIRERRRELR